MKTRNDFLPFIRVLFRVVALLVATGVNAAPTPINPVIGPPVPVGVPGTGPALGDQTAPAVAFNGTHHLAVWESRAADGFVNLLLGSRISRQSEVFQSTPLDFPISTTGFAPAVAALPEGQFLVVWADTRNSENSGTDIYGTIVKADGGIQNPGGIPICTALGDQLSPKVCAAGKDFLVVWQDARNHGASGFDLYVGRLSSLGQALDGDGIPVTTAPGDQYSPTVAANGTRALLAWVDSRGGPERAEIAAAQLDLALIPQPDPSVFCISAGAALKLRPAVTGDGTNFFAAWEDYRHAPAQGVAIYGARIINGSVVESNGIPIATGPADRSAPAVCFNGSTYWVGWEDGRNLASTGFDLYGARLSREGQVLDPVGIALSTQPGNESDVSLPSVPDWLSAQLLLLWEDRRDEDSSGVNVAGATLKAGVPTEFGAFVSVGPVEQRTPVIAYNGQHYLAVWERPDGPLQVSLSIGNDPVSWKEPCVLGDPGSVKSAPVIVVGPTGDFLIAWNDQATPDTNTIVGAIWPAGEDCANPIVFPIGTGPGPKLPPVVAAHSNGWLVVWSVWPPNHAESGFDLHARRVGRSGELPDPADILVSTDPGDQFSPAVAVNGDTALIVWADGRHPEDPSSVVQIHGARISIPTPQEPIPVGPISAGPGHQFSPAVAGNGSEFLVVWEDHAQYDSTGVDIGGAVVVGQSGVKVWVAHELQDQLKPTVARYNGDFFVAWEDTRAFDQTGFDIYGARVSRTGGVFDPAGIPIQFQTGDQRAPQAIDRDGCNVLVASQSVENGANRAVMTAVSFAGTAPPIACPMERRVECSAAWDFDPPVAAQTCDGGAITLGIVSTTTNGLCGRTFAATRTWFAVDTLGRSNCCSQTVRVVDTTAPVIHCPSNLVREALSPEGASIEFTATASDSCDPKPAVACVPPSGSLFAQGTNRVTCTATDACGNSSLCGFSVIVSRVLTNCLGFVCPSNLEFECEKPEGTLVNYPLPSGTNRCAGQPLAWFCHPPPGLFAPGTTRVMCWGGVIENGEAAYCEFTVKVSTNCPVIPPCLLLECPTNIVVPCEAPAGAVVNYSFNATSLCQGEVSSWCVPPSGSVFAPGATRVSCIAIGSDQTNRCTFTVTVTGDCAPRLRLTHTPNGLTLAWTTLAQGYVPFEALALGPDEPIWNPVPGTIVRVGDENQLTTRLPEGIRFYVLVRPLEARVPMPKPVMTAVDPSRSVPQRIVLKFREGTRIRLLGGALTFDPASLRAADRALLRRNGLTETQVAADLAAIAALRARNAALRVQRLAREMSPDVIARHKSLGEGLGGKELADMDLYYHLDHPGADAASAATMINELNALASVELAYPEPIVENPAADLLPSSRGVVLPQNYLDPAPTGIDVECGWSYAGGRGEVQFLEPGGVQVIDVERRWNLDHEDLPERRPFFTAGAPAGGEHGTAVLGILVGDNNSFGVTGIVPEADYGISAVNDGVPAAILAAAARLRRGDVILIEQHARGPASGMSCPLPAPCDLMGCGQFEFVPMEFFQANWDAILSATQNGIIVVEAAGNGSMDLDAPRYGGRFNPLDASVDSGAILVGASNGGITTSGADDTTSDTACFSNFGSRVDARGWGSGVDTLGYGDVRPDGAGDDVRQWYTSGFGGTSSASPIVAGAILAVQGILRERGFPVLTPAEMRLRLRNDGTPQVMNAWNMARPIGNLPDLRRLTESVLPEGAAFVTHTMPSRVNADQTLTVTVTLRNVGGLAWAPDRFALVSQNPPNNMTWGIVSEPLTVSRGPMETHDFILRIRTPREPGTYDFQWRLMLGRFRPIGCPTPNLRVTVGTPVASWTREEGTFSGDPVVIPDSNGGLHIFGRGDGGNALHRFPLGPGRYSGWEVRGPSERFLGNFAAARNRDNRLELFGRKLNSEYVHLYQLPGGAHSLWTGVNQLGVVVTAPGFEGDPAADVNQDGRLEVFGIEVSGPERRRKLLRSNQVRFAGDNFGVWESLGPDSAEGPVGTPGVVLSGSGKLNVFARFTDGTIRHRAQTTPGGGWSAWENLGGTMTGDPVAKVNGMGQIEIFVRGADSTLFRKVRNTDDTFSPDWLPMGSPRIAGSRGRAAVAMNFDRTLEVFVTGEDRAVWNSRQDVRGAWPGTWLSFGGLVHSDPAAERNAADELEVFVRGSEGHLLHVQQSRPGIWR